MTEFLQSLVSGLGQGAIYALLALGFVMIYKATHVISFAQPALMIIGGLCAYHVTVVLQLPYFAGMAAGAIAAAAVGMIVERVALRPMLGKPVFILAIITIGADIILRTFANRYIGTGSKTAQFPGGTNRIALGGGVTIPLQTVGLLIITALIVIALIVFFRYSRTGLAMRATALDQETALAQGINVSLVFTLAWAIAGALAGVAGTFIASGSVGIEQTTWIIALKALPAIIIGGLDSFQGAVIGGIAVGVVESLTAVYQPHFAPWLGANFALVAPYILMFIVLWVRPRGLFGTKEVERV